MSKKSIINKTDEEWKDYCVYSLINLFLDLCLSVNAQLNDFEIFVTYKEYPKSTILIHEGEPCNKVFFLASGGVKIYKQLENGAEQIFALFNEGNIISANSFLTNDLSPVSIETCSPTKGVEMSKVRFEMMSKLPNYLPFGEIVKKMILRRVDYQAKLDQVLYLPAKERIRKFYELFPSIAKGFFDKDIAAFLRIKSETFCRIKKQLGH